MANYSTLDYLSDLTPYEMASASYLNFSNYSVPSIGWDYKAGVYGSDSYALLHDTYRFSAIEGATYDIFSTSYFDPYLLKIFDAAGNTIAANSETDDGADIYLGDAYYSQDIIYEWVAPYTGDYYVSASWDQGSYYTYYSLTLYADTDTATIDTTAPSLSSISPIDGATGVAVGANFVLNFNEAVKAGSGSFIVKSGTTTVATIAVTDTSQVSFSGTTVTINPTNNLSYGTNYSVSVAAGVIKDSAGNNWAGTGTNVYDFTTAANTLNGSSGNDTLTGSSGIDFMYGGAGNDILNGAAGADVMWGGSGNDTYYVDNASDMTNEAISATNAADATGVDLVSSSVTRTLGSYLENLTLTGTAAINGTGNSLANTLLGNSAANTLNGSTGADIMLGGAGNDTYYVDNIGDKVYETTTTTSTINAGGTDTVISSVTFSLNVTGATYIESLRLNSPNAINGTGNALNNTIFAGAGNNIIDGLGGSADTVSYVYAAAGVTVDLRNASTAQTTGSSGSDLIRNVENLTGSNFNDTLRGNTGVNTLTGNAGVDTIYGYEGNDLLRGGAGNDVLYGGTGQDLFRFDAALGSTNIDNIKDFSALDDTIQLENSIFPKFGTTTTGTINSAYFKANTTGLAADSNDYIIYETDTGKLFYDADGSGAGASVQIATLGINLALTNSDFVLV